MSDNIFKKTIPYQPDWQELVFSLLPITNEDRLDIIREHNLEKTKNKIEIITDIDKDDNIGEKKSK